MNRKACFIACVALSLTLGRNASACDTRHFYNYSNVAFVFAILPSGSCSIGRYTGPVCVIPPGQTADLHYPNGGGTTVGIASADETTYPGYSFNVEMTCYIDHGGNTGNIVVNDPAKGDVKTCGTSYPCATQGEAKKK
jgi:hypothetical protein